MNKQIYFKSCILGLALVAHAGCAKVAADDIKQDAWRAQYTVENLNGRIHCKASYRAGGSTGSFIELKDSDDQIFCQNKLMQKVDSTFGEVYYTATIDAQPNDRIFIELKRKAGNYLAEVSLAPIIEPTTQPLGQITKNTPVIRTWKAVPDSRMRIMLKYGSNENSKYIDRFQNQDEGQVRFEASEVPSGTMSGNVPATITYTRIKFGLMPNGLKGTIESSSTLSESLTFQ
jgi:hypothetical protein